ncbi:tetratricopeptide repeat protein 14 isoform X1 [Triplophysa rosa]|uniref:Tetratricopeptide repeat protein 14 n=2 Tax=Triplophysa rosa TaxID=992332 RepID=A0A9W7T3V2_TRIRA|nr:tetratricopeptide repeat protein 14 isoform X1 [Triplophysa rosa]KAI7791230.1 tetratricopeptide repeat protein 14 [Triplophysa rosa]
MERDLLRQSVSHHGQSLLSILKCEQSENPDFKYVAEDLSKALNRRDKEEESPILEQFIARKADLLFAPSWKSCKPAEEWQEESGEAYAVMPPLEQFMEVSYEERREIFYRDVERGDMVIGRVNSVRDFGLFVTLLCTAGGLERDIEDLEIKTLCPIRDVPSTGNHDDPLSYYQIGDLIRAGVKDIDRYHEKLTISLYSSSLAAHLEKVKLGVINKEDLPLHYTRGEKVAVDSSETYEKLLVSSLGLSNPLNVDYLLGKLGINDTQTPSLMRGLQSKHFKDDDFATTIRKKQSVSWALKCVKSGVDHFKSRRFVDAMNEYNKALEIDTNNVEALVARGALYATKGSLVKAINDFELALENCPTHRNAKKYLCQTLVERGGQLEEEDKLVTAEGLYKRAISLDDTFQEASEALEKLQIRIQKSLKLKELEAAKEQEKAKTVETSAEKLRKILKEEKRVKKKRKRSTSSSSTTSSSSSTSGEDSPSTSHKKSKKRKHKRRRSSRSSKKHKRRMSSCSDKTAEEECFPAPANTSASFLNQTSITKLMSEGERPLVKGHCEESGGRFVGPRMSENNKYGAHCGSANGELRERHKDRRISGERLEHAGNRRNSSSSSHSERSRRSEDLSSRGRRHSESVGGRVERIDKEEKTSQLSQQKALPCNLTDIFSQIAEFEREKKLKK